MLACELYHRKVFTDKNLTTSAFALLMLLYVNGVSLSEDSISIQTLIISLKFGEDSLSEWLRNNCEDKYATIVS